mmetsp:Transcript_48018/g.94277  ORF Transcript_48018/g.94277 Transcript_48018/m.94277 type:complete len:243 (-) Transcript_48018:221-949(-)
MGCGGSTDGGGSGGGGGGGGGGAMKCPSGSSANYKKFHACFVGLAQPANKAARVAAWKEADPNGNGQCSLAELDGWLKKALLLKYPNDGETIWKAFRPSYIRAFSDARDIGKDKQLGSSNASTDDYVQKQTFRVFIAYAVIYGEMYDAFALIDGGGEGVSKDDDRKVSLEELKAGQSKLKGYGLSALKKLAGADAEAIFKKMDADGKGAVLLNEWCRYIEREEAKAGTAAGKCLTIGDDEKG